MNKKEINWIMRIRRCMSAKKVRNPADIKHKLMFYNEQTKISSIAFNTLYELCCPEYSNEEKEESVAYLEKKYKKITKLED